MGAPSLTDRDEIDVLAHYRAGLPVSQIVELTAVSSSAIYRLLRRSGLATRQRRLPPPQQYERHGGTTGAPAHARAFGGSMKKINSRRCAHCTAPRHHHAAVDLSCPDGSGRQFKWPRAYKRVSTAFDEAEVDVLAKLAQGLQRGADLRSLVNDKAFASLARKVGGMHERLRRQKAEAERERLGE